MNRRSFLKTLGLTTAAVVSAPSLLVPSAPSFVRPERLDFGVPTRRLATATQMPAGAWVPRLFDYDRPVYGWPDQRGKIPMLLIQTEYMIEHGKLPAGSEVRVDRTTAERWVRNGIATPGPSAPRDLQERSAQRMAERRQEREHWWDRPGSFERGADGGEMVTVRRRKRTDQAAVDAGWERMFAAARADGIEVG